MRSIRSFSRARTSERGFVLIAAIVLAVLYFMLIELLLIDSARELSEARRFRARIVAQTLAENGAERAALRMLTAPQGFPPPGATAQGTYSGKFSGNCDKWTIVGEGETTGETKQRAKVTVVGRCVNGDIKIDSTLYANE